MIDPPAFYSEQRQEYDLADLEQLGSMAIKLDIHTNPCVKYMFSQLVDLVGTPNFASSVYPLSQYLSSLLSEAQDSEHFSNWYSLDPSAHSIDSYGSYCEKNTDGEDEIVIERFSTKKLDRLPFSFVKNFSHSERLAKTVDALMAQTFNSQSVEDPEISFKTSLISS